MQITAKVHALRIPFRVPTGPNTGVDRFVYAFVLLGERTWLVDTGVSGTDEVLLGLVSELGRGPETVDHLVLTHGHVDHIGSAMTLRQRTGARVHAHPAERQWIEDVEIQARERPIPGFHRLVAGSVPVDEPLMDNQRLELDADLHLRVIHTPGHSPGSTSFLVEEEGVLITGDAIPVAGDMPVYDDPVQSVRSLARLRDIMDVRVVLSSWDEPRWAAETISVLERAGILIEKIHHAVHDAVCDSKPVEAIELCRRVLPKLGLPEAMANPLVARTFLAHLDVPADALGAFGNPRQ
jgi:glyoxylase-like metal-dependent hydrolase (beta-lactamase superfamily II)